MNEEVKAALEEGYDMIVELREFIRDNEFVQPRASSEAREILIKSQGILNDMNKCESCYEIELYGDEICNDCGREG